MAGEGQASRLEVQYCLIVMALLLFIVLKISCRIIFVCLISVDILESIVFVIFVTDIMASKHVTYL